MTSIVVRVIILLILTVIFAIGTTVLGVNLTMERRTGTGAIGEAFEKAAMFLFPSLLGWGVLFWFLLFKVI